MATPTRVLSALVVGADPRATRRLAEALQVSGLAPARETVEGAEAMWAYLERGGEHGPSPDLIFLSDSLPEGWIPALESLKARPETAHMAVVVFGNASGTDVVGIALDAGAVTYLLEPDSFEGLVDVLMHLGQHWVEAG